MAGEKKSDPTIAGVLEWPGGHPGMETKRGIGHVLSRGTDTPSAKFPSMHVRSRACHSERSYKWRDPAEDRI